MPDKRLPDAPGAAGDEAARRDDANLTFSTRRLPPPPLGQPFGMRPRQTARAALGAEGRAPPTNAGRSGAPSRARRPFKIAKHQRNIRLTADSGAPIPFWVFSERKLLSKLFAAPANGETPEESLYSAPMLRLTGASLRSCVMLATRGGAFIRDASGHSDQRRQPCINPVLPHAGHVNLVGGIEEYIAARRSSSHECRSHWNCSPLGISRGPAQRHWGYWEGLPSCAAYRSSHARIQSR
jgi:hypothetical protein